MATTRASPASCHSPPELVLSKLVTHLSFASRSQHDVGATRIGRRKAPAQFPFRSPTPPASLDDDSVWGLVLPQSLPPSTAITTYEAAWDAATSIPPNSSACPQAGEFSSSYSPEAITRECHLLTPPFRNFRGTASPDPVPNPLCPEDHACIPVSWKGENRGKGVAVGDGSVCLLERGGSGNRILSGPVDELQVGIIPIISRETSQCGVMENISTKPKREFPGREFHNDPGDEHSLGARTDDVFWKKSTTRKPTPAAAWDWDRMSSQTISSSGLYSSKEALFEVRGERTKHTRAPDSPTTGYIGYPNVGTSFSPPPALPTENEIVALVKGSDRASISEIRQERAVRRLKSVIGHLTGVAIPNGLSHNREMGQAHSVASED
ncbi:MAG: hypothetical protein M1840_005430 [Geoglossum simile]|nr:MAG: hypothetical protein M1840_005430 [Geoglossum simile]